MQNSSDGKPTIDIALPYYGDVALMQEAVSSVRAQTDPRWRLYVVDDGKEPGVPEWFAGLDDPRISYERNEVNLGITANYLKCLAMAEAEDLIDAPGGEGRAADRSWSPLVSPFVSGA